MRRLLAGTLVLIAATFVQAQNKPNAGVQLHADIEQILRQQFDRIDKNKDGNIDPEEAAKHFRGPNAKPAPELLNKNQGGGNPFNDKNLLEPQKPQDKPETNKPAYKPVVKPLDVQFFEAVDSNNDGLVSWEEFSSYFTRAYEDQIREYQRIMQEIQRLNQQLARVQGQYRQSILRQMRSLQQRRNGVTQHFHRFGANGFPRLPRR